MSTYVEFQNKPSSTKAVLVKIETARRITGFTIYSGSIYSLDIREKIIESVEQNGTALTEVASIASIAAGDYFLDNQTLYLRTTGSTNPNAEFVVLFYHLFFSSIPANVHKNPSTATGPMVHWLPMVTGASQFGFKLDNAEIDQIGNAIDGSGSIDLLNDQDYWSSRFDKLTFENKSCEIYSWSPILDDGEAQLIYKGIIDSKSYSDKKITFRLRDQLTELKAPVELLNLEDVSGVRISDALNLWKQRRVYGRVRGHIATSIDQITKNGYPLTGTFTLANGDVTLTGTGTAFLTELSPGDEIILNGNTIKVTVGETISSNTLCELSDEYVGVNFAGVTATLFPSHSKRWINREFIVAGHATREPTTTVTSSPGVRTIDVADSTDFRVGDAILVDGQPTTIQRISGDGFRIKFAQTLTNPVMNGDSVIRISVSNVYINDEPLNVTRDYSYDAATGRLTLDPLAEFNVASIEAVRGTSQFTNTSRQVDGTNTIYTEDYAAGDWIKIFGQSDWAEILYIESETRLFLRTASLYSGTDVSQRKRPKVYTENQTTLSLDVLGKTVDGFKTGDLISTGPSIVKDLLIEAGLSSLVEIPSFNAAAEIAPYDIGLVIPMKERDTKTRNVRDYINEINRTVFGSLVQDADFQLQYKIFNPRRPAASTQILDQHDLISFKFSVDSKRIVKRAIINYGAREWDGPAKGPVNFESLFESDTGNYLTKTNKEYRVATLFQDLGDADIFASRWAFLLSIATATLDVETKMQAIDKRVTDLIRISHPKLYERVGTTIKQKYAAVQGVTKSAFGTSLELEDLANAFSRCSTITANDAESYVDADEEHLILNGFITDNYGLQNNDGDTIGTSLIW